MSFKANNYIVSLTTSECSFPQTLNKIHNKKFLIDAGKSLRFVAHFVVNASFKNLGVVPL